jgi:O-antigen ligase
VSGPVKGLGNPLLFMREGPSLRWWGLAILLSLLLALAWPFESLRLALVGCVALVLVVLSLASPHLSAQGVALFVFLGILTAVEVGFSFKAPQLFALLALAAYAIRWCLGSRSDQSWPWAWCLPFVWIGLSWLPSLGRAETAHLALNQDMTGIRLVFNYGLLVLTAVVLFASVTRPETLWNRIYLLLCSCALSLLVGWTMQVGFYMGLYNPLEYIGKHASLVDFYGPFLRISPGTFANEYGEILQTVGILLIGLLYLDPQRFQGRKRLLLNLLLAWVVASLVINFTRASWLVFVTGAFFLLALARPPFWRLCLLGGMFYGIFAGLFRLSQLISEAGLLVTVGQRFGELSDVTVESAGQRLETWGLAWQYFLDSPWIGNGLGRFVDTHNVPLQLLAETGILGLLVFYGAMGWIAWTFWKAWRLAQDPALKDLQMTWLVAFAGCLAFDLTNHGIFHFVLWVCIALGLATARLNLNQSSGQEHADC